MQNSPFTRRLKSAFGVDLVYSLEKLVTGLAAPLSVFVGLFGRGHFTEGPKMNPIHPPRAYK